MLYTDDEQILAEVSGDARYCLLGVPVMPLWLGLVNFELVRGYSFFQSLILVFKYRFSNPYILAATAFLEFLVFLAYKRISTQKLVLTTSKLICIEGWFKPTATEIPLESITKIYTVMETGFFSKRLGCGAVRYELQDGKQHGLPMMRQPRDFVKLVNQQIAYQKRQQNIGRE